MGSSLRLGDLAVVAVAPHEGAEHDDGSGQDLGEASGQAGDGFFGGNAFAGQDRAGPGEPVADGGADVLFAQFLQEDGWWFVACWWWG